jgi:cytochrome b561
MNKNSVADIMQEYLSENDVNLERDQLVVLAKKIRQPMWIWHIYFGYVLTGLFLLRFILPIFGEMKFQNPLNKGLSFKEKFQKWTYLLFYVFVAGSLFTGLMIKFGPENLEHTMEEIHELSIYYLIAFLILHWGGVLLAELTNQKGIVSRIISGGKGE